MPTDETWTNSHGHLIGTNSEGDPTDFGYYRGQELTLADMQELCQMRDEMEAMVRVFDVTDDVARRAVLVAHGKGSRVETLNG